MRFLAIAILLFLLSACGQYDGAQTPSVRGGNTSESNDCDIYLEGMCTMEYNPTVCRAHYNNKAIEGSSGNPCGARMEFQKDACELGFSDAQIKQMKPKCEASSDDL